MYWIDWNNLTEAYLLSCFVFQNLYTRKYRIWPFQMLYQNCAVMRTKVLPNRPLSQSRDLLWEAENRPSLVHGIVQSLLPPLFSTQLPLLLHSLPYHLCMRGMFQYQLMDCCRYLPNKISKSIVSVNMNLLRNKSPPITVLLYSCCLSYTKQNVHVVVL